MTSEIQGQFNGLSKEMKEMAASITTLVKAITPKDNAAAQSGSDGITDPQTFLSSLMQMDYCRQYCYGHSLGIDMCHGN